MLAVDEQFLALCAGLEKECPQLERYLFTGNSECPANMADYEALVSQASPEDFVEHEPDESDLAGLFYTSGTTGGSKGVMLTHRNILANAYHVIIEMGVAADWMWLNSAPMFHLANGGMMFAVTLVGACHCFLPAFEPGALLRAVERYRITQIILIPSMLSAMIQYPGVGDHDISSVRAVLYGASPMPLEVLRQGMRLFRGPFYQAYGLTESSPILTILHPRDHLLDSADPNHRRVSSAGQAIIGVEVRVVDDQDRPVPAGTAGEIVARGANVMKGYWNRPEINRDVLRGGWLHTGDVGALDEHGYLYILDRKKDMIKTGGENVYSPEVESVIYEHPAVLEACVIGTPHEKWGETIKAVVVCKPASPPTERELIDFCRARLTHFKCPTSVDFVDSLPKSGTGKIQKRLVRDRYWNGGEATA